jgi:hypothetical protein
MAGPKPATMRDRRLVKARQLARDVVEWITPSIMGPARPVKADWIISAREALTRLDSILWDAEMYACQAEGRKMRPDA